MRATAERLAFYDEYVSKLISEKYALSEKESIKSFLQSQTYQMLLDCETELDKVSPYILFDMWENEQITGEPRNSQYIRED